MCICEMKKVKLIKFFFPTTVIVKFRKSIIKVRFVLYTHAHPSDLRTIAYKLVMTLVWALRNPKNK